MTEISKPPDPIEALRSGLVEAGRHLNDAMNASEPQINIDTAAYVYVTELRVLYYEIVDLANRIALNKEVR